ncbi:MAG: hypothetical protein GY856_44270, partial [bacterium]|nr:hypothetical protein [bacterium]
LAVTSHDLRDQHDRLERFLTENGHPVLPERHNLPLVAGECESYLREQLARCRMSIHLVGANYGIVPDATTQSLVTLQNELAIERAIERGVDDDEFQRLVWMPPELTTEDPRQQSFLDKLRGEDEGRVTILETSLEDLERTILEKLAPPAEETAEAEQAAVSAEQEGPAMIYLICEQRDVDDVAPLEDHLFDQGLEIVLPLFEGDETEIREEHEENLRQCDAVLIYYGAANEGWQRRMLREVKKSAGYGRTKPAPAAAVYVAPPETPQKKRLRTQEALVLRPGEEFAPEDLKPLLEKLGS